MSIIFLTSLPRCGSTWAAEALTELSGSRYVHEPFNWNRIPERKPYLMRYLRAGSRDAGFERVLDRSLLRRRLRDRVRERLLGRRIVLKDVYCCLAAERVQQHLNAKVVILTRHPCAMASSWRKLDYTGFTGWSWLDPLLSQPKLIEEHLGPFEAFLRSSKDPLFQVGAYWGASYYVLGRLARSHPEWQWVTHEELCRDPVRAFRGLLQRLGVRIRNPSSPYLQHHDRVSREDDDPYGTFRRAEAEPEKWKALLSAEEIRQVMRGAEPFGIDELLRVRAPATAPQH